MILQRRSLSGSLTSTTKEDAILDIKSLIFEFINLGGFVLVIKRFDFFFVCKMLTKFKIFSSSEFFLNKLFISSIIQLLSAI